MNAPAVSLAGHSAFEAVALAAVKLTGVVWSRNDSLIASRRDAMIAAMERLQEAGLDAPWFRWWMDSLCDDVLWRADWASSSEELIRRLGELMAIDEALGALPAPAPSRPASPPPPSGRGDEMAEEVYAARAATGDTVPPAYGDVDLPERACCLGDDTEPPAPGETQWWDDQPMVRS